MSKPSTFFLAGSFDDASLPAAVRDAVSAAAKKGIPDDDKPKKTEAAVTEHDMPLPGGGDGQRLRYRATAGTLPLRIGGEGKAKAELFYIAYEKLDVEHLDDRPLTFVFNGGPGSSSVWLHMGALGPKRVLLGDEGEPLAPPTKVVDNEWTWLDLTDVVFIDPVSTGLSRAAEGEDAKQFHTLEEDVKAVGEFIRLFCTRRQRWASPKFLVGESYGATRAAALAHHLQGLHGIYLSGISLVSPALDFQVFFFDHANDLPYVLFLPTYAATAFFHKRLATGAFTDLASVVTQAETFAIDTYAPALAKGGLLPDAEKAAIAEQLAKLTGLSKQLWLRSHLRINDQQFFKELLREEGKIVGRLDSRFVCKDVPRKAEDINADPSYSAVNGAFTAALNAHLLGSLKYTSEAKYEILYLDLEHWDFNAPNRYVSTTPDLLRAMTDNPRLRVNVCTGYFDAATPHFASDYSTSHLGLDPSISARITTHRYEAGHMMYIRRPDLIKFKADAAAFYASCASGGPVVPTVIGP